MGDRDRDRDRDRCDSTPCFALSVIFPSQLVTSIPYVPVFPEQSERLPESPSGSGDLVCFLCTSGQVNYPEDILFLFHLSHSNIYVVKALLIHLCNT
jgi:hypothetical protein